MGNSCRRSQNWVEVEAYRVKVYESLGDFIHGAYSIITRYYIPTHQLCYNVHDGKLYVFRYKNIEGERLGVTMMSESVVESLVKIVRLEERVQKLKTGWIKEQNVHLHMFDPDVVQMEMEKVTAIK